jgi:hypothetical protein
MGLCGRTTKAGTQCRRPSWEGSDACRVHTPQVVADAVWAVRNEHERLVQEAYDRRDPACWSWPAPGDGLPDDPWYRLVGWQDRRCAICGTHRQELVLDHDHTTALVRGWLCASCNISEGHDGRDVGLYAKYRQRNPATIIGVRFRYVGIFGEAEPEPRRAPRLEESPSFIIGASIEEKLRNLTYE